MNRIILATAALATVSTGGIAIAQGRMAPPSTRAEATAQVQARFNALDTDRNGQISAAEMSTAREARLQKRAERRAAKGKEASDRPMRGGRIGKRIDTNGDGQISLAEMTAQAMARFDRMDANKDGTIDAAERQAMRDQRRERRADRAGDAE